MPCTGLRTCRSLVMLGLFKALCGHLIYQCFLFQFFGQPLLVSLTSSDWLSYDVNYCWLFSTYALRIKQCTESKRKALRWAFPGSCQTGQWQFSEDVDFVGSYKPIQPPCKWPLICCVSKILWLWGCWCSRFGEKGKKVGQVKLPQSSLFVLRFSGFFLD